MWRQASQQQQCFREMLARDIWRPWRTVTRAISRAPPCRARALRSHRGFAPAAWSSGCLCPCRALRPYALSPAPMWPPRRMRPPPSSGCRADGCKATASQPDAVPACAAGPQRPSNGSEWTRLFSGGSAPSFRLIQSRTTASAVAFAIWAVMCQCVRVTDARLHGRGPRQRTRFVQKKKQF